MGQEDEVEEQPEEEEEEENEEEEEEEEGEGEEDEEEEGTLYIQTLDRPLCGCYWYFCHCVFNVGWGAHP